MTTRDGRDLHSDRVSHAQRVRSSISFDPLAGTSWSNAQKIAREGFKPSADGLLGPGVYLTGDVAKAKRFAAENQRHGDEDGCLVKCRVTVDNPKYLKGGNAPKGTHPGHDAVRTNWTSLSPHPEWVVRNAADAKPVKMTRIPTAKTNEAKWHKCKGCSYQINDNPAYRNAKAPINWGYCCEACRLGLGHGGWCQHITK